MRFGEFLREIRTKQEESMRKLGERADVGQGYIAEVEKGKRRPNEKLLYATLKSYPKYKEEFMELYVLEYIPKEIFENIKDNKNAMISGFEKLTENLNEESKLEVYKMMIEKLEFEHYRNGTHDKVERKIEETKKMIKEKEKKE